MTKKYNFHHDTYNNHGFECPYCHNVDTASWALPEDEEEAECGFCGKTFGIEREIDITYLGFKPIYEDEDEQE